METSSGTELSFVPKEFLATCRSSSDAAYELFEKLLSGLADPATRISARSFLTELREAVAVRGIAENLKTFHFAFQELPSVGTREARPLHLVLFPSVFMPEQWSKTFFEGVSRLPQGHLEGRVLAELGSGSGWISLALGMRARPEKVYGLDINPKAVTCARINLFYNALDEHGRLHRDRGGRSLLEKVEFYESDLLAWVRERGLKLDLVCGCIPQVLDPGLEVREIIFGKPSDEALYSLSNYTSPQGNLEDQFGLGLVAQAVDETVGVLKADGRILFNLGGRPGRSLLLHLFRRRGFEAREIWRTRIPQAADTDIKALAEIEEKGEHRFEFFMRSHGDESIGARTARAYQQQGGEIFHALTVVEARMRHPEPLQRLHRILERPEFESIPSSLDLSFEDESVAEEKIAFLARLGELLSERRCFPYGATQGTTRLRNHFSRFLASYLGIEISAECLLTAPNRECLVENLFRLFTPGRVLLHPTLVRGEVHREDCEILECPANVELICDLVDTLRPQMVVTCLAAHELRSRDSLERLVQATGEKGVRLFVDLSESLELESSPKVDGVLEALAKNPLPPHAAIFFSLDKNQVYGGLEICFLLSENGDLLSALARAAEVTYSRTPVIAQEYYDSILEDLLKFRLDGFDGSQSSELRRPRSGKGVYSAAGIPFAAAPLRAFEHPALATGRWPISPKSIRLDYGENALPSPRFATRALFEAFARKRSRVASGLEEELEALLSRRFGWSKLVRSEFHFGLGVAPLFAALAAACARESGTFLFPMGSYGYFVSAVEFFGGSTARIETYADKGFKLSPEELEDALREVERPWLYLNGPVVNPTGSIYSAEEIAELLALAAKYRARVVLDVLFSGLEFRAAEPWNLDSILDRHVLDLVLLGGISKELAAGGLRFGFAQGLGTLMIEALSTATVAAPHSTILDAVEHMYRHLNHPDSDAREELTSQQHLLKEKATKLRLILAELGWEPLTPQGGLFLVAKPSEYLNRRVRVQTPDGEKEYLLDSQNLPEALFHATGLLINNSAWTAIPGYCRFVYSLPEETLDEAISRLRDFKSLVL